MASSAITPVPYAPRSGPPALGDLSEDGVLQPTLHLRLLMRGGEGVPRIDLGDQLIVGQIAKTAYSLTICLCAASAWAVAFCSLTRCALAHRCRMLLNTVTSLPPAPQLVVQAENGQDVGGEAGEGSACHLRELPEDPNDNDR